MAIRSTHSANGGAQSLYCGTTGGSHLPMPYRKKEDDFLGNWDKTPLIIGDRLYALGIGGFVLPGSFFSLFAFAHRFRCASAIRSRASALIFRRLVTRSVLLEPASSDLT